MKRRTRVFEFEDWGKVGVWENVDDEERPFSVVVKLEGIGVVTFDSRLGGFESVMELTDEIVAKVVDTIPEDMILEWKEKAVPEKAEIEGEDWLFELNTENGREILGFCQMQDVPCLCMAYHFYGLTGMKAVRNTGENHPEERMREMRDFVEKASPEKVVGGLEDLILKDLPRPFVKEFTDDTRKIWLLCPRASEQPVTRMRVIEERFGEEKLHVTKEIPREDGERLFENLAIEDLDIIIEKARETSVTKKKIDENGKLVSASTGCMHLFEDWGQMYVSTDIDEASGIVVITCWYQEGEDVVKEIVMNVRLSENDPRIMEVAETFMTLTVRSKARKWRVEKAKERKAERVMAHILH